MRISGPSKITPMEKKLMRNYKGVVKFKTLKDCIEQLEFCKYKAKYDHSLESNVAFIQLKKHVEKVQKVGRIVNILIKTALLGALISTFAWHLWRIL